MRRTLPARRAGRRGARTSSTPTRVRAVRGRAASTCRRPARRCPTSRGGWRVVLCGPAHAAALGRPAGAKPAAARLLRPQGRRRSAGRRPAPAGRGVPSRRRTCRTCTPAGRPSCWSNGKPVGAFGELHPKVAAAFEPGRPGGAGRRTRPGGDAGRGAGAVRRTGRSRTSRRRCATWPWSSPRTCRPSAVLAELTAGRRRPAGGRAAVRRVPRREHPGRDEEPGLRPDLPGGRPHARRTRRSTRPTRRSRAGCGTS